MAGVKGYSTTAGSNTDLFIEGMDPSDVNDGMREVQADLASLYRDDGWRELGDGDGAGNGGTDYTAAFVSASSVSFAGVDVTGIYHAGRRVRATVNAGGFIYGVVKSSSFSTDTTVTFAWDSTSLSDGTIRLWVCEHPSNAPNLTVSSVLERVQTPSLSSGTLAVQVTDGTMVAVTLGANLTTLSVTWPAGMSSWTLELTQDGTGGRTVAWPAGWTWSGGNEGQVSTAAGGVDVFTIYSRDGGTTVRAFQAGLGMA